jgi:hypothetical protein
MSFSIGFSFLVPHFSVVEEHLDNPFKKQGLAKPCTIETQNRRSLSAKKTGPPKKRVPAGNEGKNKEGNMRRLNENHRKKRKTSESNQQRRREKRRKPIGRPAIRAMNA